MNRANWNKNRLVGFSKKFDLTGENQLKIRALFNKSIREQISKKPNWKWKFENECILLKYKINAPELHNFQDIKVSLKELSHLHKKLEKSNIASEPLEAEIESDNPKEIINKKLFKKRMAIFGILMGCGTAITSFSLFLLFHLKILLVYPNASSLESEFSMLFYEDHLLNSLIYIH